MLAWRRTRHRALFAYWDGTRTRYADPFLLWRGILNHPKFNIETMPAFVDAGQEPETSICLAALRDVFSVEAWDDSRKCGLTTWETLNLLTSLVTYLEALKKNIGPIPILSAPMGSKFPGLPASDAAVAPDATSCSSASGSTPSDPKLDLPIEPSAGPKAEPAQPSAAS